MTSKSHNLDFRTSTIQAACRELDKMEEEIKELNDAKSAYRNKYIKGDLQMKLGDFDAMRRIYNMAEDRQGEYLDALREGFKALGVEGQLDWIKIDERIDSRDRGMHRSNCTSRFI